MMKYYKVYVDKMKTLYTYSDKNSEYQIGNRVLIYFNNKKRSGIIIEEEKAENINFKTLNIESKVDDGIILSENQLELMKWMVDYYISSYDSVIKTMIPKGLNIKHKEYYEIGSLKTEFEMDEIIKTLLEKASISRTTANAKFKKKEVDKFVLEKILLETDSKIIFNFMHLEFDSDKYKILRDYFRNRTKIQRDELEKLFSKSKITNLIKAEALVLSRTIINTKNNREYLIEESKVNYLSILTDEQLKIRDNIELSKNKYHLIKGITGSGKTEIYIDLIRRSFLEGHGSIFLVPEISLTPQMINRFKDEFKDNIAILHSKLTENERAQEWFNIYTGQKKIVLGVRSAVFAPVVNLKYIILDEEHETTYKQDNDPRYNAKYVAIKRVILENGKLILGSATPSIESYYYGKKDIYNLLELDSRYNDATLPNVEIVDMKNEKDIFFSEKLLEEIKNTLIKKEQVILLLNRKGYSTYIQCKDCGYVDECSHCSIKMSYYLKKNIVKCNYCGQTRKYIGRCSTCNSENLSHSGKGIEKVQEQLERHFSTNIIMVDSNYGQNKDFYKDMYFDFLEGKYNIMIGTQIVSKGFHFPNVTLVGVINSDIILNFPDFRASEKTFQLLTQVSGRSGRGEKEGKVIIQTYQPEHYAIQKVKTHGYDEFYNEEIKNREFLEYPPFSKIINIGISSTNEKEMLKSANKLSKLLEIIDYVEIFGPMPSMVYKVKDKYRSNIFIKGNKPNIEKFKRYLKSKIEEVSKDKNVKIAIDVDPIKLI